VKLPPGNWFAPPGSDRSGSGGNEAVGAFGGKGPSKKRVQRICRAISDETVRDTVRLDPKAMVEKLNRMLTGWPNYFCLGSVSKAYSAVDMHARRRLRRWLCDKHHEPRPASAAHHHRSAARTRRESRPTLDRQAKRITTASARTNPAHANRRSVCLQSARRRSQNESRIRRGRR